MFKFKINQPVSGYSLYWVSEKLNLSLCMYIRNVYIQSTHVVAAVKLTLSYLTKIFRAINIGSECAASQRKHIFMKFMFKKARFEENAFMYYMHLNY